MSAIRIFSYLPNPRVAKATIAARLCGVEVDVRGASPQALQDWLWDFDAHVLAAEERESLQHLVHAAKTGFTSRLYKTEAFLEAHPYGTVPAAFSPDGRVGIFESNSILRAVARLGDERLKLYGDDAYSASRIDSFLDASLIFARDTQVYILGLRAGAVSSDIHASTKQAFTTWMTGIERALSGGTHFVTGGTLSIADICFVCELALFHNEHVHHELLQTLALTPILSDDTSDSFPLANAHFIKLRAHEAFAPDIEPYLRALAAQ